jgi:hypothetical protein
LVPQHPWEEVNAWAKALAHTMVNEAPDTYVATITKSKRAGKILIDFFGMIIRPPESPAIPCVLDREPPSPFRWSGGSSPN